VQRFHDTITGRTERAILRRLCQAIPSWITSDLLTGIGFLGAVLTCLGNWLASTWIACLWLSLAGLVINWLGDSLDGSLARYRGTERPQYGFFLDHTVDGFAMAFVAIGIGLSPMAHFWCALLALAGYYILVILSLTTCLATGVFRVSFGGVGPTEIRLGIGACTITAAILPIAHFDVHGVTLTIYDALILALTAGLVVTAVLQTYATARDLARIDPPRW
jgi:phosphatidylglycerophosphate synthase